MPEAYRPPVDGVAGWSDDPEMDDESGGPDQGDLEAREAARIRRRDRDANAAARALMRPGMGKVFKQILDAQRPAPARQPQRRRGSAPRKPRR